MECILHENQSLVQEMRNEVKANNAFKGNAKWTVTQETTA
jgi:hypothetical protein